MRIEISVFSISRIQVGIIPRSRDYVVNMDRALGNDHKLNHIGNLFLIKLLNVCSRIFRYYGSRLTDDLFLRIPAMKNVSNR